MSKTVEFRIDYDTYIEMFKKSLEEEDFFNAIKHLKNGIRIKPSVASLILLSNLYSAINRPNISEKALYEILEKQDESELVYMLLAENANLNGNVEACKYYLEKMKDLMEKQPPPNGQLEGGEVAFVDNGAQIFLRELVNFPNSTVASEGWRLVSSPEIKAEKTFKQYLDYFAEDKDKALQYLISKNEGGDFFWQIGMHYYNVNDYENALKYFETSRDKNPLDISVYGDILKTAKEVSAQKFDENFEKLRTVKFDSLDESNKTFYLHILAENNFLDEVIAHCGDELADNEFHSAYNLLLALSYFKKGDKNKALYIAKSMNQIYYPYEYWDIITDYFLGETGLPYKKFKNLAYDFPEEMSMRTVEEVYESQKTFVEKFRSSQLFRRKFEFVYMSTESLTREESELVWQAEMEELTEIVPVLRRCLMARPFLDKFKVLNTLNVIFSLDKKRFNIFINDDDTIKKYSRIKSKRFRELGVSFEYALDWLSSYIIISNKDIEKAKKVVNRVYNRAVCLDNIADFDDTAGIFSVLAVETNRACGLENLFDYELLNFTGFEEKDYEKFNEKFWED